MTIRPTQGRIFSMIRAGIQLNTAALIRAQEQASTGKRIVRASDDAVGTSVSLSLRRQIGAIESFVASTSSARPEIEQASARLQEGTGVLSDIRALMIQGMNGALNARDRTAIANQIELLEGQLIDVANTRSGDSYLFAGTDTSTQPFVREVAGDETSVRYFGNDEQKRVLTGRSAEVVLNVTGREAFERYSYTETSIGDFTGAVTGTTADSGDGYVDLIVRQEGTTGTLGSGIVFGASGDSIVGDRALVVDGAARTIQLGSGEAVAIPDPLPVDFAVTDENGAVAHFDLSAWDGSDLTSTVSGAASVSIDGTNFTPVTLTEMDLQLRNDSEDIVMHIDTTGIVRAGEDLVTFSGTPGIFETIRGVIDDLKQPEGYDRTRLIKRMESRLAEIDRSQDDMLVALGKLGAASQRIDVAATRLEDLEVTVEGLISNVEDADYAQVALDLQRSEQTLQLAQATGARLMQQTLLNYL